MKYYLVKYDFYSSIGGCTNDLDIVDVSYDRDTLIDKVEWMLHSKKNHVIEEINDVPYEEFDFNPDCTQWEIKYKVDGMTINDDTIIKIVERED